ncbi:MAG: phenylalanine--tRNA ligase subunit beta [Patescibacteria group bacterium]
MLFLKSWLQDYVDLSKFSNSEIAERVTNFAMEVEEVTDVNDYFGGLVVLGQIEKPEPVEGSNKLKSFKVNLGDRHVHILSAAPNVEEGMVVPVALVGAKLPHGLAIAERKMMGQLSQGMCCGKSELCLEEGYSAGLWSIVGVFDSLEDAKKSSDAGEYAITCTRSNYSELLSNLLGKSICEVFPWLFPTQTLIDIKVLPDKMGTASNYLGMAYEIALAFQDLSLLTDKSRNLLDYESLSFKALDLIQDRTQEGLVKFHDKVDYSQFFTLFKARVEGEINVPAEVALRIFLVGQNSVSPMVDISNYLLQDIGQPTHFFSWNKVEKMVNGTAARFTLDKLETKTNFGGLGQLKQAELPVNTDVIRLNTEPVLIPGISGGQSTSVDNGENEFLVEMACFRAEMVARNSFLIGYRSEAVRTFAGGVPPSKLLICLLSLKEILGEKLNLEALWLSENAQIGTGETSQLSPIEFVRQIKNALDQELKLNLNYLNLRWENTDHVQDTLRMLGLLGKVKNDALDKIESEITFIPNRTVLSHKLAEDVLGDVARLNGLSKVHSEAAPMAKPMHLDTVYKPWYMLKNFVTSQGFTETINRPFISPEVLDNLGLDKSESLLIVNPIRSQEPYCRTGLLESMLQVTRKNLDAGYGDINLFELNKVYVPKNDQTETEGKLIPGSNVVEKNLLGVLSTSVNMQELAVLMNSILERLNQELSDFNSLQNEFTKNGYEASNNQISVKIIQISNTLKKKFGIPLSKNIAYVEFNLTKWDKLFKQYPSYREDREFPDVKRSLSLYVPADVWFKQIENVITQTAVAKQPDWEVLVQVSERLSNFSDEGDVLNLNLKFNKSDSTIDGKDVDEFEEVLILELQSKLAASIKRR